MKINLYDVLSAVGKELVIRADVVNLEGGFQGESLKINSKDAFDITLRHIQKDIVTVECNVTVSVSRICSRCLDEVFCIYDLQIVRTVNMEKKEAYTEDASESDEISYIEDCTLDVDMLVLDELYTKLPMTVLCKEDCKGICKVCGMNLNKGRCDCDQTVPDPRMAVFSDIFNQFKEV